MNELQVFNFETHNVRTFTINDAPWFVGKDVAVALGYANPQKAIRTHIDDEDKRVTDSFTVNGTRGILINESGLYSLILSSKLESAKRFKRWVTSEVLPQIRKTGSYHAPQVQESEELKQLREKTAYVRHLVELIDRYNGDTAPVDVLLGLRHTNTPKTLKPRRTSSESALKAYILTADMNEGDDMKDVYNKYVEHCRTLDITPRTRHAFALRVKEWRNLTATTKYLYGKSYRILTTFR